MGAGVGDDRASCVEQRGGGAAVAGMARGEVTGEVRLPLEGVLGGGGREDMEGVGGLRWVGG